jgi:hypothetical protein
MPLPLASSNIHKSASICGSDSIIARSSSGNSSNPATPGSVSKALIVQTSNSATVITATVSMSSRLKQRTKPLAKATAALAV